MYNLRKIFKFKKIVKKFKTIIFRPKNNPRFSMVSISLKIKSNHFLMPLLGYNKFTLINNLPYFRCNKNFFRKWLSLFCIYKKGCHFFMFTSLCHTFFQTSKQVLRVVTVPTTIIFLGIMSCIVKERNLVSNTSSSSLCLFLYLNYDKKRLWEIITD